MNFNKFLTLRKMNALESGGEGMGSTSAVDFAGDVNESFDDLEYESEQSKEAGKKFEEKFKDRIDKAKKSKEALSEDEDEKPAKKEKAQEAKKGKDLDALELDSDDEEEESEEKEEKKEVKKADKKETKKADTEDEEESEEKTEAEKAEVKKLKIRMSDGLYGIESDAKVRVKVDGNFQEVPVQELINNYSGKVAYDKKFSELGEKNKHLEIQTAQVTKKAEVLQNTVAQVLSHLEDPNKNPFDALFFLVEKSGHDTYSVYKRALESNLEEVENLMSMSEVERKAFFLEKKDEFRTKSESARKAEYEKAQAFNQTVQKLDSLRQAHGVSEEQYLQALDQLESEGVDTNKMTDAQVVDYASLKPHVEAVQDVLEPYEDSLDDSKYSEVVRNFARQLRAKDFTIEQLKEMARREFLDEDVKDLQARTKEVQKRSAKVEVKAPTKFENLDFDDED